MSSRDLLRSLFAYKASVDGELLEALGGVAAGVEQQSALRVLNHAHIVDRIFAANLSGTAHGYGANWSSVAPPLVELAAGMRATDRWYVDYLAGISPAELEAAVDFTFTDGGHGRMTREEMLGHVITHSGYHRGEVGRLLPEIEDTAMRDVFAGYLHRTDASRRQ